MSVQQKNTNSQSTPDMNKQKLKVFTNNRILYSSQRRRENSFAGFRKQSYLHQYSSDAFKRYDDKKHQWKQLRAKIKSFKLDTHYSPGHQPGQKIYLPLFNDAKNGTNDSVENSQISRTQSKPNGKTDFNFKKVIENLNKSRKFSKKANSFISSPFTNNNQPILDKNPSKIYKSKMFELNYTDTPQPILEPAGPIEDLLKHPQQMTNRIILQRKTKVQLNVFYAMQLSLAYDRLIIIVNKMGDKSKRFSMIINKHHSQMLLKVFSERIDQILQDVIIGSQGISLRKSLFNNIPVEYDILQQQKKSRKQIRSSNSRSRKIYSSNSQRMSFQKGKGQIIINKLVKKQDSPKNRQNGAKYKINQFKELLTEEKKMNHLNIQIEQLEQNNSLIISETMNKNTINQENEQNAQKNQNKQEKDLIQNIKQSLVQQQVLKKSSEMVNQSIGIQISQVVDSYGN